MDCFAIKLDDGGEEVRNGIRRDLGYVSSDYHPDRKGGRDVDRNLPAISTPPSTVEADEGLLVASFDGSVRLKKKGFRTVPWYVGCLGGQLWRRNPDMRATLP